MLYQALVAVCLSTVPAKDCNRHTAVDWMVAPETQTSLSGCFIHGMEYSAQSRLVKEGTYPKVFCRPLNDKLPERTA